jgi:outer membrane protein OmpA-like peptidoglycan-associated protein
MNKRGNYFSLTFLLVLFLSINANAQKIEARIKKADVQPKRERMPNIINKLLDNEFAPAISADGNTLVYQTNRGGKTWNNYRLWEAKRDTVTGFWTEPKPIDAINSKAADGDFIGTPFLSYDGKTLFFTAKMSGSKEEDIFFSKREKNGWSAPQAVSGAVNTEKYEGSPSVSPNGTRLYFMRSSDGGSDSSKNKPVCYKFMVAEWNEESNSWSNAKELPAPVNGGCDKFFRISSDGQSAFFSSTRNGGSPKNANDFDLFYSEMKGDAWSAAIPFDVEPKVKTTAYSYQPEYLISLAPNDEPHILGYYSAYVGASYELFTIPVPDRFRPKKTCFFKGVVEDSITGKPVAVTLKVENLTRPSLSISLKNNESNGNFGTVFTETNKYRVTIEHKDYKTYVFVADLTNFNMWTSCEKRVRLQKKGVLATINILHGMTKEPVDAALEIKPDNEKGKVTEFNKASVGKYTALISAGTTYMANSTLDKFEPATLALDLTNKVDGDTLNRTIYMYEDISTITFDNINFNTARPRKMDPKELEAALLPKSKETLEMVYRFMTDYPKVRIRIEAHTDNAGGDDYNLGLSQRRSAAAKQYLVKKGISESRLEAEGFGESRPTVPNEVNGKPDKNNMSLNRRVEFKVAKK